MDVDLIWISVKLHFDNHNWSSLQIKWNWIENYAYKQSTRELKLNMVEHLQYVDLKITDESR